MLVPLSFKFLLSTTLAICLVTLLPHLGIVPFPFGYVIPVTLVIWLYLKFNKENFSDLGISYKTLSLKSLATGVFAGLLIFALINFIIFPILKLLINLPVAKIELYDQIKGNTNFYLFLVLMGWLVGGIYEEIVFHGFIFRYIEKMLPGRVSLPLSFLITNTIFGLYHFQLGYEGIINAFIAGSGYHAIILMNKRNLWYGIFSHAVFDTIALSQLYAGYTW